MLPMPRRLTLAHASSFALHRCAAPSLAWLCLTLVGGCTRSEPAPPVDAGRESAPGESPAASSIRAQYTKQQHRVAMRDGVNLFTTVYAPKDTSRTYPILLLRTPYGVNPYGADEYPEKLGPDPSFVSHGYIFVYQDVRGRFMSDGTFENMRPLASDGGTDESTDAYDTVDWLVQHIPGNNGRVGVWGVSYPGFYALEAGLNAHPAVKAISPQAPIADWFFDDFHHHGAFFLPHAFNFLAAFGRPRKGTYQDWGQPFDYGTDDGYGFYLNLGPLRNANERYFEGGIPFWNEIVEHPNYDAFWRARDVLHTIGEVRPAVMIVGGWFDAEDLYGALNIYRAVERHNPRSFNMLVMGPWSHGGWIRTPGSSLGDADFGAENSPWFRTEVLARFFEAFLEREAPADLPEALMFETGANAWRFFDQWPPDTTPVALHMTEGGILREDEPDEPDDAFDSYVSDPQKPVPYTQDISIRMTKEYMSDDQRFAAWRPDVLAYQTEPLDADVTIAGPVRADLWVTTTGTDADWVVKLIDVFPGDAPDHEHLRPGMRASGYQMMVRSEVMRGRFRNSYEHPEPFEPSVPTHVVVPLQDVLHTFCAGHRIMVQVQSTWFPMMDRNPQKYVDNIFLAHESDFVTATHRVLRSRAYPSQIELGVLTSR